MAKNYYLIIGLPTGASAEQITTVYRRRALELHPDLAGADSEPLLALQEAYSVLGDSARRREYDLRQQSERPPSASPAQPMAPRQGGAEPLRPDQPRANLGPVRLTEDFETYAPSLDEIFERIWSNFGPWQRPKGEQIRSLTVDLPISAEQAFHGGAVRLRVPALLPCPTCAGRGSVGFFECLRCSGRGKLVGSCGVIVQFPGGITQDFVTQVSLEQFGIRNLYLTVRFRVSEVMV